MRRTGTEGVAEHQVDGAPPQGPATVCVKGGKRVKSPAPESPGNIGKKGEPQKIWSEPAFPKRSCEVG
jgi:hypothetical protein